MAKINLKVLRIGVFFKGNQSFVFAIKNSHNEDVVDYVGGIRLDNTTFRNAMSKFATGITVVTTEIDGKAQGMTVNAFMSVSLDPKLVVVSIDKRAGMLSILQKAKKYAVSILNEDQKEYSMIFAGQRKDKQDVDFDRINGLPVLKDAVVTLTCNVYEEHEVGDHILFFGEVTGGEVSEREPLVYFDRKYGEFDD